LYINQPRFILGLHSNTGINLTGDKSTLNLDLLSGNYIKVCGIYISTLCLLVTALDYCTKALGAIYRRINAKPDLFQNNAVSEFLNVRAVTMWQEGRACMP
jgi:hypothetical protein